MFNVKYLDSIKKIQIPSNLNDFKIKVAHLFGINSDFDIFIKNDEINFEFHILNQYDYDLNIQDLINSNIYILIKNKYNFQSYFNLLNNNSKKLNEIEKKINDLIKDMDSISLNKNNIRNNNINKYIPNPNKHKNIRISNLIDKNIKSDYSIIILNNNETLSCQVEKINSPSPYPIEFTIYIKNNSNNNLEWPNDTILKCKNDNTDIFFYHSKWNQSKTNFNGEICSYFEIILNSKTKKIGIGTYSCRFYLVSDSKGRIGNNCGQIFLEVYENVENMNEDDETFMKRYSVEEGKVEYNGKI